MSPNFRNHLCPFVPPHGKRIVHHPDQRALIVLLIRLGLQHQPDRIGVNPAGHTGLASQTGMHIIPGDYIRREKMMSGRIGIQLQLGDQSLETAAGPAAVPVNFSIQLVENL
jgi:hypothetical protein